jgi:D-citramalate synthase
VETTITWFFKREFKTRGVDTDQTFAAIKATEKMLNIIHLNTSDSFKSIQSEKITA